MLVQYEDKNQPAASTWSWQDTEGSWLLISLAWVGLLIGVGGALYWARLSILGAIHAADPDTAGFAWLAITAAGAAIIATVLWPFLKTRRPEIASFVLWVGVISWLLTSASGTLYLVTKAEQRPGATGLATVSIRDIQAVLWKDGRSLYEAMEDCTRGVWRGCRWLQSDAGADTYARRAQYEDELNRRHEPRPPKAPGGWIDMLAKLRSRVMLFAMVALGGCIALALVWGPAEALKAMYSEPGTLLPPAGMPALGLPGAPDAPLLGSPLDMALESWAAQCLERARGDRVALATMHGHYRAYCTRRGLPAFASDEAFGRALNRPRDPMNPQDLGGPMVRLGGWPLKTGGKMHYVDVRIRPDDILDEIEAMNEGA